MHIRHWLDLVVAAANLNNWTFRSPLAIAVLQIYRELLDDLALSISAFCLPSTLNLWADPLSRDRLHLDWELTSGAAVAMLCVARVQRNAFA